MPLIYQLNPLNAMCFEEGKSKTLLAIIAIFSETPLDIE